MLLLNLQCTLYLTVLSVLMATLIARSSWRLFLHAKSSLVLTDDQGGVAIFFRILYIRSAPHGWLHFGCQHFIIGRLSSVWTVWFDKCSPSSGSKVLFLSYCSQLLFFSSFHFHPLCIFCCSNSLANTCRSYQLLSKLLPPSFQCTRTISHQRFATC